MAGADMQTENEGKMDEVLNTPEARFEAPAGREQQSDQIDLQVYYQAEIDRFAAEQLGREDDFTALKKKVSGQAQTRPLQEPEQQPRVFSWQDRIRHKTLLAEARIRGVRDLQGFQRLIEYFETTLTDEKESAWQKFRKEPTKEQKSAIIQEWRAKGYHASASDFDYYNGSFSFTTHKTIPLNLTRKSIPALKELLASSPDPISVIQTMRAAVIGFNYYTNIYGRLPDNLKKLLTTPHLKEVMDIIKAIPNWEGNWFSYKEGVPDPIDTIITLVESDNPQAAFSSDMIDKIGVLSHALRRKVSPTELPRYQQLINNPGQTEFLVSFLSEGGHSMGSLIPLFDNMNALQQAHLLEPLTLLSRNGVNIDKQIFTGYSVRYGEQPKTQADVIQELQEAISAPTMQEYLHDPEKQSFVGLLAQVTGKKISVSQIEEALGYFDRRQELVYLYDLLYGKKPEDRDNLLQENQYRKEIPVGVVSSILKEPNMAQVFTSREFNSFLNELKAQGYEPTPKDFYTYQYRSKSYSHLIPGSALAEVFSLKDIIALLGKDSPAVLLETLRGDERFSREKVGYYEFLARQHHIVETLQILKEHDLIPPASASGLPELHELIKINKMPLIQKEIIDAIPASARQQWVESVITLPDYAQRAIQERMQQVGRIDEALIQRVCDFASTFRQVDTQVTDVAAAENIKIVLSAYKGEISDLFKDGQPTIQLARKFLDNRRFDILHVVLTDKILKAFDESTRASLSLWRDFPAVIRDIIIRDVPDFPNISAERLVQFKKAVEVIDVIRSSPSKEIQRLQNELVQQLWQTENPQFYLKQILDVFERNNLPLVGKVYRVFEILHPPQKFEEKIRSHYNLSPVLVSADISEKYRIVYRDLLKISIDSGNSSLFGFLKALQEGQQIIGEIEQHGVVVLEGPENIGKREAAIRFLNRLDTLYANSNYGRRKGGEASGITDIQARITELKASLGIKGDQPLLRRVSAMFLRPLGYSSIKQAIERMDVVKFEANARNIRFAQETLQSPSGTITLQAGDLLKGINIQFLENILVNGLVAKEYLGASADSDRTPFDTDTSMILPQDTQNGFEGIVGSSMAGGYGNLLLVIRDRGQFQHSDIRQSPIYLRDKYELFSSGGERHYGIRTGIASAEIDAMIAKDPLATNEAELQRIFFTIAQNNVYVPVLDAKGKILFTPELFEEYKIKNEEVKDILDTGSFRPEELISTLKKSPFIKHLYESPVGVWEGYNLNEHTRMVMGQYEKYFADRWRSPLMSQQGFRMLLALHDLGKPLAVQITGNPANQHEYTMKFLPKIIEGLGLRPQEAEVMVSIANQDNLGQYLQGRINARTAASNIRALAEDSGVPVSQLFELIKMYFMCDAGSYTEDAGGKASLDNLFIFNRPENRLGGQMRFSVPVQGKIDELNNFLLGAESL